jgi:hypothetical protein
MFRATSCSSSGGQIVLIQHLVSSLSVGDRPVQRTVTFMRQVGRLLRIKTKSQKGGEYFIIRNFIICTHRLWVHPFKGIGDRTWELSYTGKTRKAYIVSVSKHGGK